MSKKAPPPFDDDDAYCYFPSPSQNHNNNNQQKMRKEEASPPSYDDEEFCYSFPPPRDGKSYSKRETATILGTLRGKERSRLIAFWIENGLIPVRRQQIYALLKQVEDGEEVDWSRPWQKRGRPAKTVTDVDRLGGYIEKMAQHVQVMSSCGKDQFMLIRRRIPRMKQEIEQMRALKAKLETQLKEKSELV